MRSVSSGPTGLWAVLEEGGGVLARCCNPCLLFFALIKHFQTRWDDSLLPGGPRLGACLGGRVEASDGEGSNLLIMINIGRKLFLAIVKHFKVFELISNFTFTLYDFVE